jgi:hypothetical protein
MKHKNTFWVSITIAVFLAAVPALAQGPQDRGTKPPPPPAAQNTPPKVQPPPPFMDLNGKDAQRTIPGAYRLTYTLTDMDGSKRIGTQRYTLVLDADAPNARVNLGANVPVHVGSANSSDYRTEDTGLRIFARLRQFANGVELNTDIHQTAFADGTKAEAASISLPPITRQAELSSTVLLKENKTITIGELDIPGSTHSLQVQVELTRVR